MRSDHSLLPRAPKFGQGQISGFAVRIGFSNPPSGPDPSLARNTHSGGLGGGTQQLRSGSIGSIGRDSTWLEAARNIHPSIFNNPRAAAAAAAVTVQHATNKQCLRRRPRDYGDRFNPSWRVQVPKPDVDITAVRQRRGRRGVEHSSGAAELQEVGFCSLARVSWEGSGLR